MGLTNGHPQAYVKRYTTRVQRPLGASFHGGVRVTGNIFGSTSLFLKQLYLVLYFRYWLSRFQKSWLAVFKSVTYRA